MAQVFSLDHVRDYTDELMTKRFSVPFFVKSAHDFERRYPRNSHDRCALDFRKTISTAQILTSVPHEDTRSLTKYPMTVACQVWGHCEMTPCLESGLELHIDGDDGMRLTAGSV